MDLSVKSVAALSAMAVGILFCSAGIGLGIKLSPEWLMVPVSLLIACAIGALIGFLNGVLVVKLKTSASSSRSPLSYGCAVSCWPFPAAGPRRISHPSIRVFAIERFLGIPLSGWIAIACFVVFSVLMSKTPLGRHLVMIGGNETATFRAGIRVTRNLILAFVMTGAIAGLAGWLLAIRTSSATATLLGGAGMQHKCIEAFRSTSYTVLEQVVNVSL
ncbi:ABC transporter permease [Agrobacterium bohemicum]|uniref:ABC transporter permease n=1 Tax=Agrobacterium bohemicum TaxID=2052828 RepID=UPI0009E73D7C|nr:hypothetical protein [Agrobacterium bohemicum]